MEKFNDTLGDLSQFNILSFEKFNQGFKGTQNSFTKIQQAPQRGKTIRGLKNVSPLVQFKFHNQSSDDIFNKYFPDGIDEYKDNINTITDYNVTKNEYDFNTYDYYFDTNNNKTHGDTGDKLAFRLLIFISDDGNKVKECYEVTKPADDEVILFLETDEDLFSKRVLYGKMSEKVRALFTNENGELSKELFDSDVMESVKVHVSDLNREIIEELMKKGYIENKYIPKEFFEVFKYTIMTNFAPSKAMGWISNKIGEIIDLLKTPDTFWDTENADYLFSKENLIENLSISTDKIATLKNLLSDKKGFDLANLIPDKLEKIIAKHITAIEQFVQNYNVTIRQYIHHLFENINGKYTQIALRFLQERIALVCGFWNGLVDFVSSIFKFIGGILEAPFNLAQDFQETLETIDNFLEALGSKAFWKNLWNTITQAVPNFKETLKDSTGNINWVKVHYVAGFSIAFVGTFFIPMANIAKIANVGKLGEISTVLTEITQTIGKAIRKTAKFAKDKAIKALQYLLNLIKTGGEKLKNFVDDIWKKIIAWFKKNKKAVVLVEKVDSSLLPLIRILKQNTWYLKSLKLVNGTVKNGRHGRQLGQWLAVESEAMVKLYTSFWYEALNDALNKGKKLTKELKAMKEVLDDALIRLPAYKQKGKPLLRSVYHSEAEIKKMFKVGKDWTSKGFFSTTHSKKSLLVWLRKKEHHNVIFKVYGKNGKLIEKAAYLPEEAEVLFKSGTTFVVESVNKGARHPIDKTKKITEIILKEK